MLDLIAQGRKIREQVEEKSQDQPKNPTQDRNLPPNLPQIGRLISHKPGPSANLPNLPPSAFELSIKAFKKDGIELLPEDLTFIRQKLPFEPGHRDSVLAQYKATWITAMNSEPIDHKKQNRGRYAANSWLRNAARRD